MGAHEVSVVVEGMTFVESPRWHEGRLWFSDFYTQRVMAVVPGEEPEEIVTVAGQPSGLGLAARRPDGDRVDARPPLLRHEPSGELVEHADLGGVATGHVNDMVVGPDGTAYVGNFGFDLMAGAAMQSAVLAKVDPDGAVSVASEPLFFPNGSAITPDGSTLIVSESFGNRMSAFDIAADGTLGPRRDWAALGPPPTTDDLAAALGAAVFAPDGMCLDAEGAVWVADAIGNRAVRLAEGGTILDEVELDEGCYACMLGGDDGRTLFLCVAPNFHEDERAATREGRILSTVVDTPHAGTP